MNTLTLGIIALFLIAIVILILAFWRVITGAEDEITERDALLAEATNLLIQREIALVDIYNKTRNSKSGTAKMVAKMASAAIVK